MDTKKKTPEEVAQDLQRIKTHMPGVYAAIQQRAALVGQQVYAYVRRGCQGEPNAFWACEAGHVVGTAFNHPDIAGWVAMGMVCHGPECMTLFSRDLLPSQDQLKAAA